MVSSKLIQELRFLSCTWKTRLYNWRSVDVKYFGNKWDVNCDFLTALSFCDKRCDRGLIGQVVERIVHNNHYSSGQLGQRSSKISFDLSHPLQYLSKWHQYVNHSVNRQPCFGKVLSYILRIYEGNGRKKIYRNSRCMSSY